MIAAGRIVLCPILVALSCTLHRATADPTAVMFPGANTDTYASIAGYRFPDPPFTIEGYIFVPSSSAGKYWFSYAAASSDNCFLVKSSPGTHDEWVHWAVVIDSDRKAHHYINGNDESTHDMQYSDSWCGTQDGALVLGQEQDNVGGGFAADQAPEIQIDYLKVFSKELTVVEISRIAEGHPHPDADNGFLYNHWSFCDHKIGQLGFDYGTAQLPFTFHGKYSIVQGTTACLQCDPTDPPKAAMALDFPGGTTDSYAEIPSYRFPQAPFTIEGWIYVPKKQAYTNTKYFFTYAVSGNSNCILVKAKTDIYDQWVHWAMVVDSERYVHHYINGKDETSHSVQYTSRWCNKNDGHLVLGQEQDSVGGKFDKRQAPAMKFDGLRVYDRDLYLHEILEITSGRPHQGPFYSNWAMCNAQGMGQDTGTLSATRQDFTLVGNLEQVRGKVPCGTYCEGEDPQDAALEALATRMDAAETADGALATRMDAAETADGALDTRVSAAETADGALDTRVSDLTKLLDDTRKQLADTQAIVSSLQARFDQSGGTPPVQKNPKCEGIAGSPFIDASVDGIFVQACGGDILFNSDTCSVDPCSTQKELTDLKAQLGLV